MHILTEKNNTILHYSMIVSLSHNKINEREQNVYQHSPQREETITHHQKI